MKRVPYFAGAGLLGVVAVVGLSWDNRTPVNPTDTVPTVSVRLETIQQFSAFGRSLDGHKFPEPTKPSNVVHGIKAEQRKLPPQARSAKDVAKSTARGNQKKPHKLQIQVTFYDAWLQACGLSGRTGGTVARIDGSPPLPFGRQPTGQNFSAFAGTDPINVHPHTPRVPDGDRLGAKAKLFCAACTAMLHRHHLSWVRTWSFRAERVGPRMT